MNLDRFAIIIEGTDKCGKTSLATQLSAMLGWPIVKCSQPGPMGAVHEYLTTLRATAGPFIADRFHLGESVYGPLYRGGFGINQFDFREIEGHLMNRGSLLVLMEDDPEPIVARFKRLNEDFARADDIPKLLDGFDREFYRSRLPKLRFRWHPHIPTLISDVVHYMGRRT
jgi:hypothetical protein